MISLFETRRDQLPESLGAVAHLVFFLRLHFAECDRVADGNEDRIITETVGAARRKRQGSVENAFEGFNGAIGPSEREGADKMRMGFFLAVFIFGLFWEVKSRALEWE